MGAQTRRSAAVAHVSLFPTYADIGDQIERKIIGISVYEGQIERLFDSTLEMANVVRAYGKLPGIGVGSTLPRSAFGGRAGSRSVPPSESDTRNHVEDVELGHRVRRFR
jgi:hypothetical protein